MIWLHNSYGYWRPSCGDRIARASADEDRLPESCPCCGFPDLDAVASYHCDDDEPEMDEDEEFLAYECGMMPDGTCMLAGTEECDWECPRR